MTTHQITVLLIEALACAVIGYRGMKNGWIRVAWVPATLIAVGWGITLLALGLAWVFQLPMPQALITTSFAFGAAYVPWVIGSAFGQD